MPTWTWTEVEDKSLLRRLQPQLWVGLLVGQQQGGERGGEQRLLLLLLVAHLRLLLLRLARLGELLGGDNVGRWASVRAKAQPQRPEDCTSKSAGGDKIIGGGDHDDVNVGDVDIDGDTGQ